MSGKQITVFWIGVIVVVVMGLFPPVEGSYSLGGLKRLNFHRAPGYGFLLTSSGSGVQFTGNVNRVDAEFVRNNNLLKWIDVIDFQKLLIQWFIIAAITAGLIVSNENTDAKPKE